MRLNRRIKKYADASLEKYNNVEFHNELKSMVLKKNKQRSFHKYILCGIMAIIIIVSTTLICTLKPHNVEDEKVYSGDNKISYVSNVNELNSYISDFKINELENLIIKKYYDTHYKEVLYFEIIRTSVDDFIVASIVVNVNKDFNYIFGNYNYNKTYSFDGVIDLKYRESYSLEENIYFHKVYGEFFSGKERFYIFFENTTLDENNGFISFMVSLMNK